MTNEIVVYVRPTYYPEGLSFEIVYPDGSQSIFHVTSYELRAQRCSSRDFIENVVQEQVESKYGNQPVEMSIF